MLDKMLYPRLLIVTQATFATPGWLRHTKQPTDNVNRAHAGAPLLGIKVQIGKFKSDKDS